MLFNLMLNNQDGIGSMYSVSASTWTQCLNYAESTGKEIVQMAKESNIELILNQPNLSDSFSVFLYDEVNNNNFSYIIFDTKENVLTWVSNQSGKKLQSLQYVQREFINL